MTSTLGRYFLKRYLTIVFWLFLGLALLIFIVNFTETTRSLAEVAGFDVSTGLAMAALDRPASRPGSSSRRSAQARSSSA